MLQCHSYMRVKKRGMFILSLVYRIFVMFKVSILHYAMGMIDVKQKLAPV